MKKFIAKIVSVLLISCLFFACTNPNQTDNGNNNRNQQQQGDSSVSNNGNQNNNSNTNQTDDDDNLVVDEIPEAPKVNRILGVTFDFKDAKALAKLEEKKDGNRAITNADDLGDLVKILADGSMENAITVGENCSLSDIVAIYKSPLEESRDIFIVFNGESVLGYEEVEKDYEWGGTYTDRQEIRVGQLICLHEDGSVADILKKDDVTDSWNAHMSLKTESVTFDAKGNVYLISSDNGDMIYQFNPITNQLTKMVAAVENTYYEKMQIDDEGEWIFVSGSRYSSSNSYFLRAIPIANPNGFVNVFYSSDWSINVDNWGYDNKSKIMYFIARENMNKPDSLYIATKSAGFKDKKYCSSVVGEGFSDNNFFDYFQESASSLYWYNEYKTEGVFDSEKTLDSIIQSICGYQFYDLQLNEYMYLSKDDVDVRFDKYFSANGKLKALAVLTAGKKNEDALEALNNKVGMAALWCISGQDSSGKNWFENQKGDGYNHNFLADIIYVKDSDVLLVDSDDSIFEYNYEYVRDENGQPVFDYESNKNLTIIKSVKGSDFFRRTETGLFESDGKIGFVDNNEWNQSLKIFGFSDDYYKSDKTLDADSLLDYFFSYCNIKGEKEFRLTGYENDGIYGSLYTTLKNTDAIEWIASDVERLNLFGSLVCLAGCFDYSRFMNFLSTTCYIANTDQKAINWNWDNSNFNSIPYSRDSGARLNVSDTGIYYEYYNTWGDDPYYYIVQVADSEGKFVELVNKLPLPSGKVVQSEKNNDRILLQYSVMDLNGAELGYHHIYSVEMETGDVTNCFDNVPNRNALEVVSFNSAGDLLYYSAVRGTSVENGIVNIVTNEYNPLTVQRKMVAVYTFN